MSVCLSQTKLIDEMSPIQMLKAVKNETEIEGMKRAHVSVHKGLCKEQSCAIVQRITGLLCVHVCVRSEMLLPCASTSVGWKLKYPKGS